MRLDAVLRHLVNHPMNRGQRLRAVLRFARWQIGNLILGAPVAVPFAGKARLLVSRGMAGATGNIYSGLHDPEDMCFIAHALRPGDLFIDVGANVGSYSVLASAVAGAATVAVEPVPSTFEHLRDNVMLNRIDRLVECHNVAAGGEPGEVRMTTGQGQADPANHIVRSAASTEPTTVVPVRPLDELLAGRTPFVIKIDTEGYEGEVIAGARRTLSATSLQAVLIEINGCGARYGSSGDDLHSRMLELGFRPAFYDPFARTLTPRDSQASDKNNTLYVRDFAALRDRLIAGAPLQIFSRRI